MSPWCALSPGLIQRSHGRPRGWAPVSRVDDLMIPQDEAFTGVIAAAIESCPWEEI